MDEDESAGVARQEIGHDRAPMKADSVQESWLRCRWSGLDPAAETVLISDVDGDTPLLRAATSVVSVLSDRMTRSSTCAAVANAHGQVVWRWTSDHGIAGRLDRAGLLPGSDLSEDTVGTNGIGTAIEVRRTMTIHGEDHFRHSFARWYCVAAPIQHPITRRTCGAVNMTCDIEDASPYMAPMVQALASSVATRLESAASEAEQRLLDAFVLARSRLVAPVMAVGEHVVIADEAVEAWDLPHAHVRAVLREAGPDVGEVVLRDGLRARVWPVNGACSDVLLVLHLDPDAVALYRVPDAKPKRTPLEEAEAKVIAKVIAECGGNKTLAAARLGIAKATLYERIRRYGLGAVQGPSRHPLWEGRS